MSLDLGLFLLLLFVVGFGVLLGFGRCFILVCFEVYYCDCSYGMFIREVSLFFVCFFEIWYRLFFFLLVYGLCFS